jgi:hypothetical protein
MAEYVFKARWEGGEAYVRLCEDEQYWYRALYPNRGRYALDLGSGRIYGPREPRALLGVSPRDRDMLRGVRGELHTVLDVLRRASMRTRRSLRMLAPLDWYVVGLFPEDGQALLRPYVTRIPVRWERCDGFVGADSLEALLRFASYGEGGWRVMCLYVDGVFLGTLPVSFPELGAVRAVVASWLHASQLELEACDENVRPI